MSTELDIRDALVTEIGELLPTFSVLAYDDPAFRNKITLPCVVIAYKSVQDLYAASEETIIKEIEYAIVIAYNDPSLVSRDDPDVRIDLTETITQIRRRVYDFADPIHVSIITAWLQPRQNERSPFKPRRGRSDLLNLKVEIEDTRDGV